MSEFRDFHVGSIAKAQNGHGLPLRGLKREAVPMGSAHKELFS